LKISNSADFSKVRGLYRERAEAAVAVKKILLGQVWRKDGTNDTYLVTKLYNEVFATFAMLRKTQGEEVLRVKVEKQGDLSFLRGFTYTQDEQSF
jgi:hypothetical protein